MDITKNKLKSLSNMSVMPESHISYLKKLKKEYNFEPEVIYDIGACVLHWTKESLKIWPNSTYYLFDGMDSVGFLYDEIGFEYHLGVLSDVDDKEIIFYQSNESPGGNSYYKEYSWATELYYGKNSERIVKTITVDTVVKNKNFKSFKIEQYKNGKKTISYFERLLDIIEENRDSVDDSFIQNQIDTVQELVNSTLYKLKFLK